MNTYLNKKRRSLTNKGINMCENNYGYMVPCHQQSHHLVGPVSAPYDDEDYYAGPWTTAEYVPNNSEQCQLE